MNEEKKYSIIGKVEIGTDEYRDLIERAMEAEKKADRCRVDYWGEQSKNSELQKKLDIVTAKLNPMEEFINSSEEIKAKYALFLVNKDTEESED